MNLFGKAKQFKEKIDEKSLSVQQMVAGGADIKSVFLNALSSELKKLATANIKSGKLNPAIPYRLKPNADRLITAWKSNHITASALRDFEVTDEELTSMIKDVLVSLGFKEIVETETGDSTVTK